MTILEKLTKRSEKELRLYKEGVFWIAYEEDAYLLTKVKMLKPTKKFVKTIQQDVVSVGFPSSVLEEVLTHFRLKKREETLIVLETDKSAIGADFEKWKNELVLKEDHKEQKTTKINSNENALIQLIRGFKLHSATPMDCMLFIEKVQHDYC